MSGAAGCQERDSTLIRLVINVNRCKSTTFDGTFVMMVQFLSDEELIIPSTRQHHALIKDNSKQSKIISILTL